MRRRGAVTFSASQALKNALQTVAARDDNPHGNNPQVEQQSEIVQVPVKERVFVVPFDLQSNAIFVAIDRMSRTVRRTAVNDNGG